MKDYFYVIKNANLTEIEKLMKLATGFRGFLIAANIILEVGTSKLRQIIDNLEREGINKLIIADLKLTYTDEEEINSTMRQLLNAKLNGVTVWGLLDKNTIDMYKKYYQDFGVYTYLGKTDIPYSVVNKILELGDTKCDGIFLSFEHILDLEKIRREINTNNIKKPIYLYIDRDENVLVLLNH